jgi:competence protein ComEC
MQLERGPRADPSLLIAGALCLGAVAIVAPLPAAFLAVTALASSVLGRGQRLGAWGWSIALAAALWAHTRAGDAIERDRVDDAKVAGAIGGRGRCALTGAIITMPRRRGTLYADVLADVLDCDGTRLERIAVRLYDLPERLPDGGVLARGDRVEVVADLARARRTNNPELGHSRPREARRAIAMSGGVLTLQRVRADRGWLAWIDRLRAALRGGIDAALPIELRPIAAALVLGEEDLAPDDDLAFRRSGLTHLLAVSGSHVALVVLGLVALLRWLLLRSMTVSRRVEPGRVAAALGIPLAIAYDQLAGDAGAARRATAMAIVLLVLKAAGRRPNAVRALAVSIMAAWVVDPLAPFDLSFALSLAATLGLLFVAPWLMRRGPRWLPRPILRPLSATLSASVCCAPLIAGISASVPVIGVLANIVAMPVGELLALPLANALAVMGACFPAARSLPVLRFVSMVGAGALASLAAIARWAAAPSWATAPMPPPTTLQLTVMIAAALVVAFGRRPWARARWAVPLAALLFLADEGRASAAGAPRGRLRISVLDVGQGDATLIDLPDGRAMLVDGGGEVGSPWNPGKVIVGPLLAVRRRRRLAAVVLSHPHPDHFLGLVPALDGVAFDEAWDSGEGRMAALGGGYRDWRSLAAVRGARVLEPSALCGRRTLGGATIEVLAPCPAVRDELRTNDNSLVLRIGLGARHALLVGDAERAEERLLLGSGGSLAADFLKVGHHGSKTSSTPSFVRAVGPQWATISCGARNRFGHPHPSTLATLRAARVDVRRTDRDGEVVWSTDGRSAGFEEAR